MKLHLHIGTFKTGSTTLQHFLLHNAKELSERGVAIPSLMGNALMPIRFSTAVGNPQVVEFHKQSQTHIAKGATLPSAEEAQKALQKTFNNLREDACILSWEGLPLFFPEKEDVERLADQLGTVCDKIQIVIYLRRQDSLYASLYGELIYQGRFFNDPDAPFSYESAEGAFGFGESGSNMRWFDYAGLTKTWADVFGAENVLVRPFEKQQLVNADIVSDFLSIFGLDKEDFDPIPDKNKSIDRFQMEFLRHMLRHLPSHVRGELNPAFLHLGRMMHNSIPPTTHYKTSTRGAREFLQRFEASNAYVARTFLGRQDGRLFLDSAPADNSAELPDLTVEKAMEITGQIWNEQWNHVGRITNRDKETIRKAEAHAATLRDAGTALLALGLSAQGKPSAAKVLFAGIPNVENRKELRDHLFQTHALQNPDTLALYLAHCPPALRTDTARENTVLPPEAPFAQQPRPARVLVFRSAPPMVCIDLFAHLFRTWPGVQADVVIQKGSTLDHGFPFAERLYVEPARFSAESFFSTFSAESLRTRYDLAIIPTNGELAGYAPFFEVASKLACPTCAAYRSDNLLLPEAGKVLELMPMTPGHPQ